jgi:hypothetical protein
MFKRRFPSTIGERAPNAVTNQVTSAPPPAWLWIVFALAHIPLAIAMQAESLVAYAHGFTTFALGMWWAVSGNRLHRVAWVCAYIAGSEVLWRMTTDALPWESGKYMVLALSGAALLSARGLKSLVRPGLLFAVLLPSAVLTVKASDDYATWRGLLSFNLSGPLALVLCAGFFSYVQLSPDRLLPLLLMIVLPSLGIAGLVMKSIMTAETIQFTMGSNFALSGGFGPNQVSLALGLGALAALWGVLETGTPRPLRLTLFVIMLWLAAQSALTFSRGGLLGALGASIIAIGCLIAVPQMRRQLLIVVTLMVIVGGWVILPMLVEFTGGRLAARFQETNTTGREVYGRQDLKTWEEHPVLGVGPGLSALEHTEGAITHTEFTRLLAEHGAFGAFAVCMLCVAFLRNVHRAPSAREKGLVASVMVWSMLYMTNAAMRTVAPAFMFGLGFCAFESSRSRALNLGVIGHASAIRPRLAWLASHHAARTRRQVSVQPS